MQSLADIRDDYNFLDDKDERTRLLVDLGKELEPMNEALKNETTLVRGCQAKVWTYPTLNNDGSLHFLADSNSGLTKGIIALILAVVQDQKPTNILAIDVKAVLSDFNIEKQLTSVRTSGLLAMIEKIRETAARYASPDDTASVHFGLGGDDGI